MFDKIYVIILVSGVILQTNIKEEASKIVEERNDYIRVMFLLEDTDDGLGKYTPVFVKGLETSKIF